MPLKQPQTSPTQSDLPVTPPPVIAQPPTARNRLIPTPDIPKLVFWWITVTTQIPTSCYVHRCVGWITSGWRGTYSIIQIGNNDVIGWYEAIHIYICGCVRWKTSAWQATGTTSGLATYTKLGVDGTELTIFGCTAVGDNKLRSLHIFQHRAAPTQ